MLTHWMRATLLISILFQSLSLYSYSNLEYLTKKTPLLSSQLNDLVLNQKHSWSPALIITTESLLTISGMSRCFNYQLYNFELNCLVMSSEKILSGSPTIKLSYNV